MIINYLHAETRLLFLCIVRLSFLCGGIKIKNMIWIIIAGIIELLYVIGIISYIKDEMSREFLGGYITVMTITNVIAIILWVKYFV